MKRRRVIVGLVVLAVAVAAFVVWPGSPRPCRATFEQVREGMTYDEVCATVGAVPGKHTENFYVLDMIHDGDQFPTMWWGDDCVLSVDFGKNGRAAQVSIIEPTIAIYRPSLLDRLCARLGL